MGKDIIAGVFEHSITDGLALSQRFRLTQEEIWEGRHEFVNKQVAEKMRASLTTPKEVTFQRRIHARER